MQKDLPQNGWGGNVLQSLDHLGGPTLDSFEYAHASLPMGSPELDTVWPQQLWAEGKD